MVWVTNRARSPFDIQLSATPMPQILALEMQSLLRRLVNAQQADWFPCDSDPQWESQAEFSAGRWWPVPQHPRVNFEGLEHALELKLHPDAVAWYSQWWAGGLDASAEEGEVHLIQLWNPEDFDGLISNLIGHALNKRRSDAQFTVFFATTEEDSELFLSIDNDSGAVVLEAPMDPPFREVAPDLASFLARLDAPTISDR